MTDGFEYRPLIGPLQLPDGTATQHFNQISIQKLQKAGAGGGWSQGGPGLAQRTVSGRAA
jgi:hypothetical protein